MAFAKISNVVTGGGNATLATEVTNTNTAVNAAMATALQVANVNNVTASPTSIIYNGTIYVGFATISYTVTQ